jgi:acetyltransferase-like isoleucine patch superfamily enzyme
MHIFHRGKAYLTEYGLGNCLRKVIFLALRVPAACTQIARKLHFFFYTRCWADHILGRVYISSVANHVKIGKDVTLYPGTILEVSENGRLQIGNHTVFSYGTLIACHDSISIGNDVMIGEYTSLRDTTHTYSDNSISYLSQSDKSEKIAIGNNVWIGRGCIILPGTVIEDGVIIGANSVVSGHLQANGVFAGAPARLLKMVKEPPLQALGQVKVLQRS